MRMTARLSGLKGVSSQGTLDVFYLVRSVSLLGHNLRLHLKYGLYIERPRFDCRSNQLLDSCNISFVQFTFIFIDFYV